MRKTKRMTKKEFDLLIKENLIKSGVSENEFTYSFDENRNYTEYYSKSSFKAFISDMKDNYPQHYVKFNGDKQATSNKGGAGGELKEKNSRFGMMPPKMASVASSSRFCYLALRDGINITYKNIEICSNNVEFEKECKILSDSRTAPQLDAFISDGNIYVEAKCHEIFDSHKPKFKNKYWKVFENDDAFSKILPEAEKGEDEFVLPLSVFNISKTPNRFDIKQFVCHLFGIANQNLNKEAKLMYLFFIPTTDDVNKTEQVKDVFNDLTEEINTIFQCEVIKFFCKNHNIKLIAIAEKAEIMQPINNKNKYTIYWEE